MEEVAGNFYACQKMEYGLSKVGVCLIAKDEGPYLVEWVAHYLALGFDELLIYDNESTDNTAGMLMSIAKRESRLKYIHWANVADQVTQISAYEDALSCSDSDWLAFFDADELLVLKAHSDIHAFLKRYPPQAGAVAINWLLFGSSGRRAQTRELQSVRFRRCAKDGPGTKNRFVKSIVRKRAVDTIATHTSLLKPGFGYFNECGEPADLLNSARSKVPTRVYAQLNHYVVRSLEEYQAKRQRGNAARTPLAADKYTSRNEEFFRSHDCNDVEDFSIAPWISKAAGYRGRLRRHLDEDAMSEYD